MAAELTTSFAVLLRQYRTERGLTQEALGERAGLSARGIRALESGERASPQRETVRLLADALELPEGQRSIFEDIARREGQAPAPTSPEPVAGFLGARPVGPLVAREQEVVTLAAMIERVAGGRGQLVMLAGEPGIGKTRLAQEVALMLEAHRFLVAAGRCYEPERAAPYYPFVEVVDTLYKAAPAALRTQVPLRWNLVRRLLPESETEISVVELGSQDVQQRLFWAVSGFLLALAESVPVALLLDDLHWADDSSLKLLRHLVRQTRGSRVFLLGTYRDVEVQRHHPLERTLADLHRERLLEEIALRRLDKAGTGMLSAGLLREPGVSREFAELVHRHTDGNPFFTEEVMRALIERGDVFVQDGTWNRRALEDIEVPRSIRSAIGERVSRLSEGTQAVLREASVLGQTFGFDELRRMGGRTEEEVDDALEEALSALLVRATGRDEYTFNHALTQQTLYSELTSRRRSRLHAAAGEALAQLPDAARRGLAARIARHFLEADRSEPALPFALLAGDEAEGVFAHTEAAEHYRTALELASELQDQVREAAALQKLGVVLHLLAQYDEAVPLLERAIDLYRTMGNVEAEARATYELAFVHYNWGTPERGLRAVQAMTERLERDGPGIHPPRAYADLYSALAFTQWSTARYEEVLAATQRAAELARAEGYTRSESFSRVLHGMALAMLAPLPKARSVLEEAGRLCEASGDTWWVAQAVGNVGRTYVDEGNLEAARAYLERSRTLIEAAHDRAERTWAESNIGQIAYLRGDWAEARATYTAAADVARGVGHGRYLSYALAHLGELYAAEGDWPRAWEYISEAIAVGERCSAVPSVRKGHRLLAEHSLEEGRPDDAVKRLQPLLPSSPDAWPQAFPPPVLAEAYLALGESEKAEDLTDRRIQHFRDGEHRRALALWLPVQAKVRRRQGRPVEAEQLLREAISLAVSMPYPHAEAMARQELATLLAERRELDAARAELGKALGIFSSLGARVDAEQTEQALVSLDRFSGPVL